MKGKGSVVLIYDYKCSLCRGCMKWIELHAIQKDIFEFIPCQSEERRNRFPQLSDEICMQSIQLILSEGQILSGNKVLPEVVRRLKGFAWLYIFFKLPVINTILYAIYYCIANNRYIISHTIKPLIGSEQ